MQTFKIEKTDIQCVVTWRYFTICGLLFMFVWLAIWTVCCVAMIEIVSEHDIGILLIALFFWFFWMLAVATLINMLFGKTRLVLDETGLASLWTCLFFKRKKRIDLTDINRFEGIDEGGDCWYRFRVVCREKNAVYSCVPSISSEKEIENLCNQLNALLETLKQSRNL